MLTALLPATSPRLGITEKGLWLDVETALAKLCSEVKHQAALVYASTRPGDIDLDLVVDTTHQHNKKTIELPSLGEFLTISHGNPVIPKTGQLNWLDPIVLPEVNHAVLFAHRTGIDRLVLIVFLSPTDPPVMQEIIPVIREFIQGQLWAYIDNALFGIELDALTAETGHLMGGAIGRVSSGVETIYDLLTDGGPIDHELLTLAKQAVDDGLKRLDLIRHNFYEFALQRRSMTETKYIAGNDEAFDAVATLHGLMPVFSREAESRALQPTRLSIGASHAPIHGPESLLKMTLINLYDNALKFSYSNTFIDIRMTVHSGRLSIVFQNLGIGVAPDEARTIFQRLRRSRFKDPTHPSGGLGLGLAYCRRVVEDIFNGTIALESRPIDASLSHRFEGDNWLTTVMVDLPLDLEDTAVAR